MPSNGVSRSSVWMQTLPFRQRLVLSPLVIIAILFGLRLLCYIFYRLLKREEMDPGTTGDENLNDGLETQPAQRI
ncbi:hypothetical protein DITRI_Ditri02bG0090000 [Diplodiscus trichospermus]